METIGIKRRQTFQLRKELERAGWAIFDGNNAMMLLGFYSAKNRTTSTDDVEVIGKSADIRTPDLESAKNRTEQCEIPHSGVRNTALAYKEEPAKEPAKRTSKGIGAAAPDARTQHVAIQTCRQVAKSYPPKELWDKLIQVLGNAPNTALLVECRTEWVERGYNRASWKWATEWYATGVPARSVGCPPKQNKAAYVGATKPNGGKQVNAEDLAFMEEYIGGLIAANDLIHLGGEYDAIIQRGGAKAEWEIRCVAYYELHKDEPATPEQMAQLDARIQALAKR